MSSNQRPNVLLICADHWPGKLLGCAGHPVAMTPTVDRIAANGIRFSNAYSACPVCVPARRTLMTGLTARSHAMRSNQSKPMPDVPTMAQCFRDAGYQAFAVGKLHVSPPRNRIGFDDALVNEEGRHSEDMSADDWELFLAERGCAGQEYAGSGTQNDYMVTPWHLPDDCHQTSWTAREMCKVLKRRDNTKPGFWYMSFAAPHPPLWPLQKFLDQYQRRTVDLPLCGDWVEAFAAQPPRALAAKLKGLATTDVPQETIDLARRAFYAMVTHIDHQIRMVLGTLREQQLASNTIVAFTSDHGEMLGDHRMWGKTVFYEASAKIPFIVAPAPNMQNCGPRGSCDDRMVELGDMMPTLLELAGIPVPSTVEGRSVFSGGRRTGLYGEHGNGAHANRMFRDERHKLIYYPDGNRFQLFDLANDPNELEDLSDDPAAGEILARLQAGLAEHLYDGDPEWIQNGKWVGLPAGGDAKKTDFAYGGQRGLRFM